MMRTCELTGASTGDYKYRQDDSDKDDVGGGSKDSKDDGTGGLCI
jgi:hypothetical protein